MSHHFIIPVYFCSLTSLLFRVSQLNKLPDSIYSITRRPLGRQIPRKRTIFLWSNFPIIRNSFAKSVITASVRMFSFKLKCFHQNNCSVKDVRCSLPFDSVHLGQRSSQTFVFISTKVNNSEMTLTKFSSENHIAIIKSLNISSLVHN